MCCSRNEGYFCFEGVVSVCTSPTWVEITDSQKKKNVISQRKIKSDYISQKKKKKRKGREGRREEREGRQRDVREKRGKEGNSKEKES